MADSHEGEWLDPVVSLGVDGDVQRVHQTGFDGAGGVGDDQGRSGRMWFPRSLDEGAVATSTKAALVVVGCWCPPETRRRLWPSKFVG